MDGNIQLVGTLEVKPGKLAEFKGIGAEFLASSRGESGTLAYEWYTADEKTYHFLERYADSKSLLAHLANFNKGAERFMATCDVKKLVVYGEPNPELATILSGFGATFMKLGLGFNRY